ASSSRKFEAISPATSEVGPLISVSLVRIRVFSCYKAVRTTHFERNKPIAYQAAYAALPQRRKHRIR
ncbi:hypothetical protein, partial [Burkholderia cenocepacia]|uniref:hypothetical protein n=1 Tax=Burkholderia cenocepacia TaxID=95486 RepID=UPI00222E1C47